MKIAFSGQAVAIDDVECGTLFQFRRMDATLFAIKAVEKKQGDQIARQGAVVVPSHPGLDKEPGLFLDSVFRDNILLTIPDAELAPSASTSATLFSVRGNEKPGHLLVSGLGTFLVIRERDGEMSYLNLANGELLRVTPKPHLAITAWSIVRLIHEKPVELCRFPEK